MPGLPGGAQQAFERLAAAAADPDMPEFTFQHFGLIERQADRDPGVWERAAAALERRQGAPGWVEALLAELGLTA